MSHDKYEPTTLSAMDTEPPELLRTLTDLSVKVGTRTRFLVEIKSNSTLKVRFILLKYKKLPSV